MSKYDGLIVDCYNKSSRKCIKLLFNIDYNLSELTKNRTQTIPPFSFELCNLVNNN